MQFVPIISLILIGTISKGRSRFFLLFTYFHAVSPCKLADLHGHGVKNECIFRRNQSLPDLILTDRLYI